MSDTIQMLLLEDQPVDAELMLREIRKTGVQVEARRVMTEAEFDAALRDPALDLILCDYSLPAYDGVSALMLARKKRPDVPFIVVSGNVGEEAAIDMLHLGATDYVLKHRMSRLAPAVQRVLTEAKERRQLQKTEEERRRLSVAMEQTYDVIVITDAEGAILYANPAFERVTGYTRQEAIGQNPRILKSGKHDAAFYRQMWDTLVRGEVWHGHFINKKKDGSFYEEDATISPVRDATGRIINFVAVKRDITAHVALEAQLRQSQKMEGIGTLAGGVAHEINNPINGIMNYAQLIADSLPQESKLRQFADGIMKETNRVATIVRNLLAFARYDKQGRSLASLNDIIRSVLSLVQAVIRHDQIALQVEVPEGLPQMECRGQQIEQVLMNLLTNARDALNEKYPDHHDDKIIRISAVRFEKDGQPWIRTTIEDHGLGIPEKIRDHVFDPFFTTKPVGKGTGLGLSISHGIVKDHDGVLHFETEPGKFTRFYLDLPVKGTK